MEFSLCIMIHEEENCQPDVLHQAKVSLIINDDEKRQQMNHTFTFSRKNI